MWREYQSMISVNFADIISIRNLWKEFIKLCGTVLTILSRKKGATYYGVAMAVARIAESIVMNENAVLPVTSLMEGEYGLEGLCISVPTIVSQKGAEKVLEIPLSDEEKRKIAFFCKRTEGSSGWPGFIIEETG